MRRALRSPKHALGCAPPIPFLIPKEAYGIHQKNPDQLFLLSFSPSSYPFFVHDSEVGNKVAPGFNEEFH